MGHFLEPRGKVPNSGAERPQPADGETTSGVSPRHCDPFSLAMSDLQDHSGVSHRDRWTALILIVAQQARRHPGRLSPS